MRIALAQILAGTDPAANLSLVADYTRRAAEACAPGRWCSPEGTMSRFGVPLAPVAEATRRALGRRCARHRRTRRNHRGGRHVHSDARRPGHQHAAGHRTRRRGPLRQDPPLRRLRFRRVRCGRAGPATGRRHRGRRRGGTDPLLRHPLPEPLPRVGRPGRAADHGQCLVGCRTGEARAVDAAGAGQSAGFHVLRRRGGTGISRGPTGQGHQGADGRRGQPGGLPARRGAGLEQAPTPNSWWPTSTSTACPRCAKRSGCSRNRSEFAQIDRAESRG